MLSLQSTESNQAFFLMFKERQKQQLPKSCLGMSCLYLSGEEVDDRHDELQELEDLGHQQTDVEGSRHRPA
jgi:hypothetical protein